MAEKLEPDCKELATFFAALKAYYNEEIGRWHIRSRMALHILLLRLEEGFGEFTCGCGGCREGGGV